MHTATYQTCGPDSDYDPEGAPRRILRGTHACGSSLIGSLAGWPCGAEEGRGLVDVAGCDRICGLVTP